jgi:hypothetical protein
MRQRLRTLFATREESQLLEVWTLAARREILPAYLFEVKKPEGSKYPWDYYKLVATIPAEEAARPLNESECPLVKK